MSTATFQNGTMKDVSNNIASSLPDAPKANGGLHLTSVDRVASIPLVHDSINQFQGIVHSTNITTKAYALAENIVKTGYSLAEPVLGYGAPVIQRADGLANKGLDLVENNFPYPFQTKTDQIVADGVGSADKAARSIYENRIQPIQGNAIVQKAIDTIYMLNQQITATYAGSLHMLSDLTGDAQAKIQALSHALLEQLGTLQKQGGNLPAIAKDNVTKGYNDLSAVVLAKDKDIGQKTTEIVNYVSTQLQPLIDSAVKIALTTKEKAEETAAQGVDGAQGAADNVKAKGQNASNYASSKGQEAANYANEKQGQAQSYTSDMMGSAELNLGKAVDVGQEKADEAKESIGGMVQ